MIKDVLSNSTALAKIYNDLVMKYPELQFMLQADLQYKPLVNTTITQYSILMPNILFQLSTVVYVLK